VKQFPTVESHLGVRASYATPAQMQVWSEQVWLNTTFISQASRSWDKLAVET
jgi:energy-converting hydrogenase Eha subunit F